MRTWNLLLIAFALVWVEQAAAAPDEARLAKWLKRFPQADVDRDGRLSAAEAATYRDKIRSQRGRQRGAPSQFEVDPGWSRARFPEHAMCYRSPDELKASYPRIASFPKQAKGVKRIVGTGHSFMAPGYRTFPLICRAAGFEQPLLTHTGGGITGSARFKWEQENGIFQFDRDPHPKLLASIANAEWDAMMWGPYFNDRPEYYACWIEFCLRHHPHMKFYLSDSWPSIRELETKPTSEKQLSTELFVRLGNQKQAFYKKLLAELNGRFPDKVYILPTSAAMILAVDYYHRGKLPGIEGIHRAIGKKERSLWSDPLGHLGPGLDRLEGYVFYATIYGRSPELIDGEIEFRGGSDFPSRELDLTFRKIAWQAVVSNPLSGVTDVDGDGVGDRPPPD